MLTDTVDSHKQTGYDCVLRAVEEKIARDFKPIAVVAFFPGFARSLLFELSMSRWKPIE